MMNRRIRSFVLMLLCAALPVGLAAQTTAANSAAGCTYQRCALRIESSLFSVSLVKGASGEHVARMGGFGGGVDVLLNGPDSAAAFARDYVHSTRTASVLGLLTAAAYVTLLARSDNFRSEGDGVDAALAIGGGALLVATIPFTLKAQRSLSRAVWWYNAALSSQATR